MNKLLLFVLLFFLSCSGRNKLETALDASGNNRVELEKVLNHYSKNDADSLKLRAAVFLIENMPEHYTYEGKDIDSYIEQMDSLNPGLSLKIKRILYSLFFKNNYTNRLWKKKYDIESISSDYLITNIDFKFELMKIAPWGKDVLFDDFCEFILPYRIDDEPLFELSRDSLKNHIVRLNEIVNSLTDYNATIMGSKTYIINKLFDPNEIYKRIVLPNQQGYYDLDCAEIASNLLENMKSISIPAMFDYVPHWGNANGRHFWINYIDTYDKNTRDNYIYRSRVAKIYRKTYAHNKSPKRGNDYVPDLFSPFLRDVTDEYVKTKDIQVHYRNCKSENVYLSTFNAQNWRTIAWAKVGMMGTAHFEKMGTDVVYLPTYYVKSSKVAADYPFILENNGQMTKLIPDKENRIKLSLNRKHPKDMRKLKWDENLVGVKIIASNDCLFNKCDTICTIHQNARNSNYVINVDTLKQYRYLKMDKSIVDDSIMLLSELSFIDKNNQEIKGKYIIPQKTATFNKSLFEEKVKSLSDKDPLSFTTIREYMIVDFGKPQSVKSINIVLRNDGNYIYPENTYELMYFDKDRWVSHETKVSDGFSIEFDNVPSGALYWLKNLTKGKEERIFTYENDKMRFW